MVDPLNYFRSSQCSMTGVTKTVVCAVLSMVHIKDPLLLIKKNSSCSGSSGFLLSLSK